MKQVTAETITDEQIRELRRTSKRSRKGETETALGVRNLCDMALGNAWPDNVRASCRANCVAIWNARHGGES